MSKRCTKCKSYYLVDAFYKDSHTKDGLKTWCINCIKVKNALSYIKHSDNIYEYHKNRRGSDDIYRLSHDLRSRIEYTISNYDAPDISRFTGINNEGLRSRIESRMNIHMTKENKGLIWNISFRKPLASAKTVEAVDSPS